MRSKFKFSFVAPTHFLYRSRGEKLLKYKANLSYEIMSLILVTTLFHKAMILQGENWVLITLGFKGLK